LSVETDSVARPDGVIPPTRRELDATTLGDDVFRRFSVRHTSRPGGATSARVAAASQPAGGGEAARLPVVNADERRGAKLNERAIHGIRAGWAGRAEARREPTLDDCHPMVPILFALRRSAAIIDSPPLNSLTSFRPLVRLTSALRYSAQAFIRQSDRGPPTPGTQR